MFIILARMKMTSQVEITFLYAGRRLVLLKSDHVGMPCNLIFQNVLNFQLC